jgi:hypothetical protein
MEVPPVDKGKGKEVVVLDGENEPADRRGAAQDRRRIRGLIAVTAA